MAHWLTDEQQAAWRAFLLTHQLLSAELDRQLQRDAGMPHAYYAILVTLSEQPDRTVLLSQLAVLLNYSQSRLSHAITRMEAAGWVRREPCSSDRRSTYAVLTDTGSDALTAAAPGHVACVRENLFDQLSDAQVRQLREICESALGKLTASAD
jgi:DNA-binding MarR family transcriptional regulator